MSDADVSRLNFQLLVTTQERDTGYQERDRFQEFYQITSRRAELLDRENQELQRSIMDLQELVAGFQSGAIYQRLNAEVETLVGANAELQEEVRLLQEIESTRDIPTTLLQATLEEVSSERDQLELEKDNMSEQLMEKIQLDSEINEKGDLALVLQLYYATRSEMEERVEVAVKERKEMAERVEVAERERKEMAERVDATERERNEMKQKALALEKELSAAKRKISETARQLESMREELTNVTRDYDALQTEHRQLCHRMQRRRWLDRRLRKHFHQRNPPAVHQDASIVRSLHERFQSLVRRRRAAVLMESLCFAFFVAKQQDAARARILYGTAVSDDRWEVVEGGANPEGVAVPEGDPEGVSDIVPEKEEGARVYYRSELVVPSDVCKVLRHYLPVDVQREASERQEERLQSPLSSINLVCPSSVDHSSCWLGRPHHQGKSRQRMRVVRSINRRCSCCGQPLKKSLLPNQPHSTRCGMGPSGGGWPQAMVIIAVFVISKESELHDSIGSLIDGAHPGLRTVTAQIISIGLWTWATFRRQVQRYMRGVV